MNKFINEFRAYLGGMVMALGIFGLLFFSVGVGFTLLIGHFFGDQAFDKNVSTRLIPIFLFSITAILYGLYEAARERKRKP